jgi:macrophage erythroblast attacher
LVRERKVNDAIIYLKKFLAPWNESHLKAIQHVLMVLIKATGLLAFTPATTCAHYLKLYNPERWQHLLTRFQSDLLSLHALTKDSMLTLTIQAGITALKTHSCYNPASININCPVCEKDTFGRIAPELPNAHHVNSSLVCYISGKIMDESNPPLVLPNGYCYSSNVININVGLKRNASA